LTGSNARRRPTGNGSMRVFAPNEARQNRHVEYTDANIERDDPNGQ
jgi:hypothetical protein